MVKILERGFFFNLLVINKIDFRIHVELSFRLNLI